MKVADGGVGARPVWMTDQASRVEKLKQGPCTDCGRRFPTCVMEFFHARGQKKFAISQYRFNPNGGAGLDAELAKCDLVCANCRKIRSCAEARPDHLRHLMHLP